MNPLTLETNKLFENVYDMKIPKRVPIMINVDNAFNLEYAGMDLRKEQYSIEKNIEAIDISTRDFDSDCVFGIVSRLPVMYAILGAKSFQMGGDGFLQHPETYGLEVDEYDQLIADPYKCVWDIMLPRLYTEIGKGGPEAYKAITKGFFSFVSSMGALAGGYAGIANKYGKSTYSMVGNSAKVPFDYLADQMRSFTGALADIRRCPEKVLAANDALLPIALKSGLARNATKYNRTYIALHMGTYLKPADYAKFYWPTFKALVEGIDAAGSASTIFAEENYTPYLDYLYDLPAGQLLMFEYGDPKIIKNKLGKQHILAGFYPLTMLNTATKEQCIDKAKELIDILAPGGNYIFMFDKSMIRLGSINIDNLKAVLSYVKENGAYMKEEENGI